MKEKKTPFFIKIKNAIINFDSYKEIVKEKLSDTFKYFFKLMLLFSIIITIVCVWKIYIVSNVLIEEIKTDLPEFSFKDDKLIIKGENKRIVKGDDSGYFGIIVDSKEEKISEVKEVEDYQSRIVFLSDKIVIKDVNGIENEITYKQLNERYDIDSFNNEVLLELLNINNLIKIYLLIGIVLFISLFVSFSLKAIYDILILSLIAFIFNSVLSLKLKYKNVFNISLFSLTLPFVLYVFYFGINVFNGFTIKYFDFAYNAISYIYVITIIMMFRSDLTKQQMEVGRIINEQKKLNEDDEVEDKEEKNDKDEEKKENKENKDSRKDEDKKEENKKNEDEPEGNEA